MITVIQAGASVGTFLVFVITAFLALRQLTLSNKSNQLAGLQAVSAHFNGAEFDKWFEFVLTELPKKMKDRSFRESLSAYPVDRDVHLEIRLADWYEETGIYARYGVISEAPLMEVLRGHPDTAWEALDATVSLYRASWGPSYFRNFEYLAKRSRNFYGKLDPKRISRGRAVEAR